MYWAIIDFVAQNNAKQLDGVDEEKDGMQGGR